MTNDEWIDPELSSELPVLRDKGEGQRIEFKKQYPASGGDLAREIAAFASSNSGRILIGVADDGSLVGLHELSEPLGRDTLCRRIEGLCSNNVKPAITPVIKFAQEEDKNVLVIEVPKGSQPIYYSGNKPYIRHLTQSRPAEPHEVIERIVEWSRSSPLAPSDELSKEDLEKTGFLTSLASALIEVIIYGSELDNRNVNPWLDEIRFQLGSTGRRLREMSAESIAQQLGVDGELTEIADLLGNAENHRLTMGGDSWSELEQYIANAVHRSRELKASEIDGITLSTESVEHIHELIRKCARRLSILNSRAEEWMNDARIEEVQSEASDIGDSLLRATYFNLPDQREDTMSKLRGVGHKLHIIETIRLYMDGGESMRKILEQIHNLNGQLQGLVDQIEPK